MVVAVLLLAAAASIGIAVASISTGPVGQKSWYWQNPIPQGNILYGTKLVDSNNGWAVGAYGVILNTDDGGAVWDVQNSTTTTDLLGVDFTDANNGWVVGNGGKILHTTDGGATWAAQPTTVTANLRSISMATTQTGWAVGDNSTVIKTTDGGATWSAQALGTAGLSLYGVSAPTTQSVWIVGSGGALRQSINGGTSFNTIASGTANNLYCVKMVDANTGWFAGGVAGTPFLRKITNGAGVPTLTTQASTMTGIIYGLAARDTTHAWIVGAAGYAAATVDGATWTNQSDTGLDRRAVSFANLSEGLSVGQAGTVLHTDDGGTSWAGLASGTTLTLYGQYSWSATSAIAVGANGAVLITNDGGVSWQTQGVGSQDLRSVSFVSTSTGWVVGGAGTIRKTTDGGATWVAQAAGLTANQLNSVMFVDANNGWACGNAGTVLRTVNGGTTWTVVVSGTANNLNSLWAFDANTVIVVGNAGTSRKTINGGTTWAASTGQPGNRIIYGVSFADANTGWMVGARIVYKTVNGGTTWVAQTSPFGNNTNYSVHAETTQTAWFTSAAGGIAKTANGGTNWTTQTSGTNVTLYSAWFTSTSNGRVLGANGVIRQTTDGGTTWTSQAVGSTDTLYAITFYGANSGWAAGANGVLMRTTDAGATWLNERSGLATAIYGLSFCSTSTGWFSTTAAGIRKSTDGGRTWVAETSNGGGNILYGIRFVDANNGIAVGAAGTTVNTVNGGTTWVSHAAGATDLRGVYSSDPLNAMAVGLNGTIYTSLNGGTNWTLRTSGTTNALFGASMTTSQTMWAVGANGTILRSIDRGATWKPQTTNNTTAQFNSITFSDANSGWACGNGGVMYQTINANATTSNWAPQSSGTINTLQSVWSPGVGLGWTSGEWGSILHTTDSTPPTTTITTLPSPNDGTNGWFVTAPLITLTPNEPSITRFSWDTTTGVFVTYSASLAAVEGTHTLYYFSVDPGGNRETTQSAVLRIDLAPPSLPASVSASALSTTSVGVSWAPCFDSVSGLAYYELLQNGSLVGTTTSTSAVVTSLTPETVHAYTVRAVDIAGNVTGDSSTATLSTLALLSRPPASVYARHAYRGVFYVDWDEPTSTVGAVTYRVWRSDANGPYVSIANIAGLLSRSYIDTTAPDPTPISYAISVIDARGEGATSTARPSASATTPVLPAPTRLRAIAVTGSVETSWVALPSASVAGYVVLRSTTSTGAPVTVTPSPVVSPSFSDTSAVAHTEYWYRVAAIDLSDVRGSASLPVYVRADTAATTGTPGTPHGSFTAATDACALCHSVHGATNATALLRVSGTDELPLCYSCHDGTSASDVFSEYADTTRVERHAVAAGSMPGTMRCASCHDPHGESGAATRRLLYNGGARVGDAVCYNGCHGTTSTVTPRGDLRMFEGSGHASGAPLPADGSQVKCLACHVSHSSRERSLYPLAPDERCVNCHSADGALPGAADILKSLSGPDHTTRHDLLEADQAATGARMACGNCHEPHSSSPATKLVDPDDPKTTGGWSGTIDGFCLRCHDAALPTSAETTGWVLPPLGSGGTTYTSDIASRWAGDVHGGLVRTPLTLRADMGYAAGDPVACNKCHDDHGSSNRWALRESVTSKSGATTVAGLLVYPVGGGADTRYFCNACHDVTAASHPATEAGGADISVFPMDCTAAGCHAHGVSGL